MSPKTVVSLTRRYARKPCGYWVFASHHFSLFPVPSHPLARWTRDGDSNSIKLWPVPRRGSVREETSLHRIVAAPTQLSIPGTGPTGGHRTLPRTLRLAVRVRTPPPLDE